jgi:hypothetical protein
VFLHKRGLKLSEISLSEQQLGFEMDVEAVLSKKKSKINLTKLKSWSLSFSERTKSENGENGKTTLTSEKAKVGRNDDSIQC